MRAPSRQMPKFVHRKAGPWAWLALAVLAAGMVFAAWSEPKAVLVVLTALFCAFLLARASTKRAEDQLRRLAETREGQSICEFARDFDARSIDTWIIRAVYEQLQSHLRYAHPAFPVRASDRLKLDLHLDDDDLDMDIATEVEQRSGRSLGRTGENPYFGKVETVRDLVLFFQSQPRCNAANLSIKHIFPDRSGQVR